MKIGFFLRTGSPNRGAEAIIRGFSELLSRSNSNNAEIVLFSANSEEDKRANIKLVTKNVIRMKRFKRYSLLWLINGIFSRLNLYLFTTYQYGHIFNKKKEFDLIIIVGADNYDIAYNSFRSMHILNILLRNKTKAKLFLYDCSIDEEYFTNNKLKNKLQEDLKLFDAITVREQVTLDNFKRYLSHINVQYFPDPAFVMPMQKTDLPENWVEGKMIGINVSNLIINGNYGDDVDKIKSNYYYLIEKIINESNNNIVFIPHVMQGQDLRILSELYEKYKNTNRVILIGNEKLFAPELKFIISQCRFLVTARTHASIAAYSTFVPTLVLGYSVKSIGIAKDLFGSEDGYVISVQGLKYDYELWEAFKNIMNKEDEIKQYLHKIIPGYQEKLNGLMPFIKSMINDTYT